MPTLIFPVAGAATYIDDFGQPRAGGAHQGNDMMAAKKTPVVAVEAGKVKFWTTSASAGCMLYLYGASGTTYMYIHLNNDLTMKNDNRGKCVPGVSYARGLKDGAKVSAGQMIGYVGDRRRERDRIAPALRSASRRRRRSLAVPVSAERAEAPVLRQDRHAVHARADRNRRHRDRHVDHAHARDAAGVPDEPEAEGPDAAAHAHRAGDRRRAAEAAGVPGARLLAAYEGGPVVVWTQPALATTKAMLGADGALSAALVQLG